MIGLAARSSRVRTRTPRLAQAAADTRSGRHSVARVVAVVQPILDDDVACGQPCRPEEPCEQCAGYWERMEAEGLWQPGVGWTDAAVREWGK